MAYCVFRLFSEKKADEQRLERLRSEVLPNIRNIAGFQRFATIQTSDGRYGGFQVYDTRDGVDQAVKMLNEWREKGGGHDPAVLELRGETGLSIVVNPNYETAHGTVRIYRTQASFDEVNAAIEHEGGETIRHLPGMLRYTTAKFEDGRIATFTACETEAASRAMAGKARELRGKPGSQLSKVLPTDPEVIMGEIKFAVTSAARA
ncbi:MAG: hypothetical protein JOZ05_17845 [Acetobacteraceae bacterium]|nr:hypothetical protein [Acetobacteraceae bacterium]